MSAAPLPVLALRIWRESQARFPSFTHRDLPDNIDMATGMWADALERAIAAGGHKQAPGGAFRLEKRWFTPAMCRAEPNALFAFGDNLERRGSGPKSGQAVIRHEPNAVGIVTKRAPHNRPGGFLINADLDLFKDENAIAFAILARQIEAGGVVVWPADGIGTGRARLSMYAPRLAASLERARVRLQAMAEEAGTFVGEEHHA